MYPANQAWVDMPGVAYGNTRLYTGREWLPELGLYDYRQRLYNPNTGRFLTRDPVYDPANLGNSYTYVGNNPGAFVDPFGEERWGAQPYWRESLDVGYGFFIGGPIDIVTGTASAVVHPIQTAQGIASLASGLVTDPLGTTGGLASSFYAQFEDSDTAGQATFSAVSVVIPGAAGTAKAGSAATNVGRGILTATPEVVGAGKVTIRSRVLANIDANRAANEASRFNVHLAVEGIHANANKAVATAKETGLTNRHGALGTRAHREFARLNAATRERLTGRGIYIEIEPFRDAKRFVPPRTKGSLSVDALLQYRGVDVRGFDLKTGKPWSRAGLQERVDRFGVPIQQLRHR